MDQSRLLDAAERVPGRPFTDPEHSQSDLVVMRFMARQLIDTYDDPVLCDFIPNQKAICMSDPKGRHFRIYYVRPERLFTEKDLTVVGFFGKKRENADIKPLIKADKAFEKAFVEHTGLLSLSTSRLPEGDFANLVIFTDEAAKERWNYSQLHYETVQEISPPYYESVRLNNAVLPDGLDAPDDIELLRVKYIDYDSRPPWRAVRMVSP